MQKTWTKICGITRAQDAIAAAELGADAIGVNFYPKSPRAISVADLPNLVKGLPERVAVVALFVNPTSELVREVMGTGAVDLLQFHGEESAEFCEQFEMPYMKVVAVKADSDLKSELAKYESAQYILLDSFDPILLGGTGKTFDWSKVKELTEQQQGRLILAGGLAPANVREAIEIVQPFGVDVSSGVEASKGIKDSNKMKLFIEGVRASG
ncbi:MAG: phosphoribosylanthranilate isomerase [SAR86 cluster bacterium]|uniref:N-(5'-phosphoribosyl)anthranilate isomerase n=1 Tax=SAR86 cluster bacterium TaxID=2030880 RepID=A0A2A4X111_9GAMM|nr:MAG: phosphoribosylanthranilate isomerase [SAR86 cluster bacterium]